MHAFRLMFLAGILLSSVSMGTVLPESNLPDVARPCTISSLSNCQHNCGSIFSTCYDLCVSVGFNSNNPCAIAAPNTEVAQKDASAGTSSTLVSVS